MVEESDSSCNSITRRRMLQVSAGAALSAMPGVTGAQSSTTKRRTGMGLVVYDCIHRRNWLRERNENLFEPLRFLKHCHSLGTGGMQASLGVMTGEEVREVRDFAGENDLFIDGIIKLPENDGDVSRFEAEIRTAGEVGVQAVRVIIMPGRRYEQFKTLAAFKEFEKRGLGMLERARPIVEKHRVRLAVENHKDQRIDERLALFERFGGEYIGACLDTGNSFALLDGVYEPVEALAPYAFSVHLKDQAVMEYEDGFLFGDIALGQGSFDLKRIVGTIKESKPKVRFSLELITRDALKVPCLTEQYFATMPDMPAADLARTMRFVREHKARALQPVTALPLEERVKLEDSNIDASVRYAGTELGL